MVGWLVIPKRFPFLDHHFMVMLALSFGQISYNNDFKKLAEQFQKVNLDAMAAEVHVKISTQNTVSTFQSKNHKVPFTHVFLFLPILLTFPERKTF